MDFKLMDLRFVPNGKQLIENVKNGKMTLGEAATEGCKNLKNEKKSTNTLIEAFKNTGRTIKNDNNTKAAGNINKDDRAVDVLMNAFNRK